MANGDTRNGAVAPYGPWNSFTGFVKELVQSAVPPFIDGSLFRGKSGSTQSELRGALRFFGLIQGEKNETTERLRRLVEASKSDPETWKTVVADMLITSYAPIVEGVDMESGTRGQLEEAFRERGGAVGSVNRKALRFFLNGMTEAGFTLSPHFGAERGRAAPGTASNGARRTGKGRQKKTAVVAPDEGRGETPAVPAGTEVVTCSIPNGRNIQVMVPADLTAGEEKFLVSYLQGYFDLKRGQ